MIKSPAQIAYVGRSKEFLPNNAESLWPVPEDLLGAEETGVKQLGLLSRGRQKTSFAYWSSPRATLGGLCAVTKSDW